jgi:Patatin-like phospholipase
VAAVVFSPDRAARRSRRRTGLVLGAGGVLGAAWMTGALACLQDRLPCAASDVDVIVGTSAGSVLAAALRCHASLEEMIAWQRGQATGILSESAALAARDGPLPPLPRWRFGSVRLAPATLLTPHRVPPWVGAYAWLPAGRGPARRAAVPGQRPSSAPSSAGRPRRAAIALGRRPHLGRRHGSADDGR